MEPARSRAELVSYKGLKLVAVLNRPAGPARRRFPAVLFLHGFPGAEKNVDVQRALLDKGVGSLVLHFAGAWGSSGEYRFLDLPEQAAAGLRFLARQEWVDARRLGVFGFSMGGWTALHLASRPEVKAAVAVAPVGGPEMVGPDVHRVVGRLGRVLRVRGALGPKFVEAVRRRDPAKSVAKAGCPILLVHGTADETVPYPVSLRLKAASGGRARLVAARGAGHDFLDRRPWLTRLTARWLAEKLRA